MRRQGWGNRMRLFRNISRSIGQGLGALGGLASNPMTGLVGPSSAMGAALMQRRMGAPMQPQPMGEPARPDMGFGKQTGFAGRNIIARRMAQQQQGPSGLLNYGGKKL